jgi:hypothetical protein
VPDQAFGFGTPFAEQIAFLRAKLNLPTERWDDITRAAHDRAFIVAGAAKADLLTDLRGAVDQAVQGGSLGQFRKDFDRIVATRGWTGWTGEGSAAGVAWRTKVIYQTNLLTSHAAGRYRQLTDPDTLDSHPYWQYVHSDSVLHPRPLHQSWDGLTLRHDHPFWAEHFPPNGWGCRCRIRARARPLADAATAPPAGWDDIDPKTGAPAGIDKGFDYAPGASATRPLQELINDKLIKLDAPIGAQMAIVLEPALAMERRLAWTDMVERMARREPPRGETLLARVVAPDTVADLAHRGVVLDNAAVWLRDHELAHALRATKEERAAIIPADVWRDLPALLASATPYLDTGDQAIVYALSVFNEVGKVLVRVNYNEKGRFDGARLRITSNFIRTGGLVAPDNLAADARYVKLKA